MTNFDYVEEKRKGGALNIRKTLRAPSIESILKVLLAEPNDLVVDASMAEGRYALALAFSFCEANGRGVVFACDTNPDTLDDVDRISETFGVSQHVYPVRLDLMAPYRLPFREEQIDCILCVDRIPWKLKPVPYLEEFLRVLKPCGTVVIAETSCRLRCSSAESVGSMIPPAQRRHFLNEAGFDIVTTINLGNYIWCERVMKSVVDFS